MRAKHFVPSFVVSAGIAVACNTGVSDSDLVGVWTNDDDASIVMTLQDASGSVTGTLTTPDDGGSLPIEIRRDALDNPMVVVVGYAPKGYRDLVCAGCDVSGNHMTCADQLVTSAANNTGSKLGRSCHWTRTSAPSTAAACNSVIVSQVCAIPGCPASTVSCNGGTCPPNSTCVSGSSCQCDTGYEQMCCSGAECPSGDCNSCPNNYWGCAVAPPVGCGDALAGASGTCECSSGPALSFACGTNSTCEQLCSGGGGADGGSEGAGDASKG